jgi:fibronectin-binding autotransporter adhesin
MSTTISGLTWANNDYYYLRWSSDDIGGSGSRDEFGLDDISLSNFLTGASGGGSIFDTNDATAGSGATVGSYNWSDANWTASAAGTDTTGNYSAGVATFAAGTDATGAITMNVDTAVSASGLSFEEGAFTIANASGGTLTLTGSATATVASGLTAAVSQAIGGTAGLTKAGAGTFNLSGANIYTGATAVNEGELGVSGGDAIPNSSAVTLANVAGAQIKLSAAETIASLAGGGASGGNVNLQGHTLTLTGSSNTSFAGVISGASGSLVKNGSANQTLTGDNSFTGLTDVQAGTLTLNRSGGAIADGAPVQISGGTLAVTQSDTVGAVTLVSGTISGAGTLTGSSFAVQSGTISAPLGGSATLTKTTAGSVSLTGNNTYTGLTDVQAGTLTLNRSGGAIADASAVQVSGGTLAVTQSDTVGAITLTSGTISGAGTLTGSSFAVQSGTISAPLAGSGALTKSTAGTVTLSGANTFTGATNISAGTLALTGGGVLSSSSGINMTGGTFDISGISSSATTIASLVGSSGAVVRIGTKTLTVGDGSLTTFAGALESTTGGLTKAGAGTFNITQSNPGYGGGSSVTAGTLSLGASNALGSAGQIAVTGEATLLAGSGTTQANPLTLNYVPGALTVLAYWNFNALNISTASAPGSGGVPLTISADSGAGTLSLAGFTGTVDDFAGTTVNNYLGAVAGKSLSLIGPAGNDSHLQISGLDFTGYTNPAVTMATQDSGAGYDTNQWSYSVDGAAFNNAGSVISPAGSYSVRTSGTIPALDGTPSAWLRYTVAGASSALGNNRIDNVQVTAYAAGEAPSVGIDSAGTASFTGAITLNGEAVFTAATSGTAIFSGNIVDGGSAGVITKTGGGTVQLTGNNSYTGATRINAGTLSAAGTGIGDFSAVILSDVAGAQLVLTGNEQVGSLSGGGASGGNVNMGANVFTIGNDNTSTTFAGVLSGTGGILNKRGSGTFNLTGGNTFTGGVVVNNGTMVVPSVALDGVPQALGAGGPVTMQNNAALVITGGGDMDRNLVLSGSSATLSVGTTVNFAGTISNAGNSSLIKTGAGTFNLTGSGDWNGDNYVVEGALAVTGAGGINGNNIGAGSITVSAGAALNIDTSGQVRASGVTALTGAVVRMDAGTLRTNSVTMNGSGTFNWQGGTLQAYSRRCWDPVPTSAAPAARLSTAGARSW